jgi:hypothetical protein
MAFHDILIPAEGHKKLALENKQAYLIPAL